MRHYQRRHENGFPYFKLARWDPISLCYRDGKEAFPSVAKARAAAKGPGRYRVSQVNETGRADLDSFDLA